MKKIIIILTCLLCLCGCDNINEFSDTIVYTTLYPIEYATSYLYGEESSISNIYPSGSDYYNYTLTDKQKDNYSKGDIMVYSSATGEAKLAVELLNKNSELTIIDATRGVSYNNSVEELWLDPSNYLMIARNIKSTLMEYESSVYDQNNISALYDELKIKISEIDVDLTMMGKNASRNNILVSNDALLFLSKYNINVVSLDSDNEGLTRNYADASRLIQSGDVKYIYTLKGEKLNDDLENFIKANELEKIEIDSMYTLSDEQKRNGEDYLSIMKSNIEKFKTELFR